MITGLYIQITTAKLRDHHEAKATRYRTQADNLAQEIAENANISNNPTDTLRSRVVIAVEGDLITLKATTDRPRYTEAELLAQCDPDAPMSEEDRQWFAG